MGFFSGKTKEITTGGNVIRGLKDEGEALRPLVDRAIEAGGMDYQSFGVNSRIAGFTDPQVAGQQAALGVAGQGAGGLQGIQQGIAGLRQTAAGAYQPLTQQDIAAQRELLAGSEGARKLAAERGFKEGLMDIGGASAGSVGGYGGTRADLLRGDALGTYAMGLAGIEGDLQTQAYQGALDQRALAAQEANQMAQLYGLEAGAEADVYGRQLGQAQTQMDIGAQQQAQEQREKDFESQEFLEEQNDPFLKAQKATGAVTDFSTLFTPQQTTLQKKKSGFDRALGLGVMAAGILAAPMTGGASLAAVGSGAQMAQSAYGGRLGKYAAGSTVGGMASYPYGGSPMTVDSILASKADLMQMGPTVEKANYTPENSPLKVPEKSIEEQALLKDLESGGDFVGDKIKGQKMAALMKAFGDTKVAPEGSGLGQPMGGPTTSQQQGAGDRRIEYVRGIARADGGSVALEEGGILSRVLGGAKNIASSIGSGIATGASNAYQNFQNMPAEDKIRYGLAIMAEEDRVGDSGGQALARAVSGVKAEKRGENLEEAKLARAQAKATKDASTPTGTDRTYIFKAVSQKFGYDYDPLTGEIRGVLKPEQTAEVARLRAEALREFKRTGGDMASVEDLIADYQATATATTTAAPPPPVPQKRPGILQRLFGTGGNP
jgi:hypothetical protein